MNETPLQEKMRQVAPALVEIALVQMADGSWIPPVKRLAEEPSYEELLSHHAKETTVLNAVIQELAGQLQAKTFKLTAVGIWRVSAVGNDTEISRKWLAVDRAAFEAVYGFVEEGCGGDLQVRDVNFLEAELKKTQEKLATAEQQMMVIGGPDFKADWYCWKIGCWVERLLRPVLVRWFRVMKKLGVSNAPPKPQ